MRNVFITGATGFLGGYLLKRLLDDEDVRPIVLARAKKDKSATERAIDTLKYFYGNDGYKEKLKRILIVEGAVDKEYFGLTVKAKKYLMREIDEIYHAAAMVDFGVPLEKIREINVGGTKNVLDFALLCRRDGRLSKVNHISTAFVAGTTQGVFHETDLNIGQKFNNTYEQTKLEAEELVNDYIEKKLPLSIFRTSVLCGESENGRTSSFRMLYKPLHLFASELMDVVPIDRSAILNMVPVNSAAEAIFIIGKDEQSIGGTFNIVNDVSVSAGEFMDIASVFLKFKKPRCVPLSEFNMEDLTAVQKSLISPFAPYFNSSLKFDARNARSILDRRNFRYPILNEVLLEKLFMFCVKSGYIKIRKQYVAAG